MRYMGCALALSLVFFAACSSNPVYQRDGFDPVVMDRIVVLPCMDAREEPDPDHDSDQIALNGQAVMVRTLKFEKGYKAVASADTGDVASYELRDLPAIPEDGSPVPADPGWAGRLGPAGARWILVPVLHSLTETFGGIFHHVSADVGLYLFDQNTGLLEWYDVGSYSNTAMGLATIPVQMAAPEENFVGSASVDAVDNFPEKD